jgi:hypothetical protein
MDGDKMKNTITRLLILSCIVCFAVLFSGCGQDKNEPTPSDNEDLQKAVDEIVERRTQETPEGDEITRQNETSDDSSDINWPEDVPLMEPYEVQTYMEGTRGFKQIGFETQHTLEETFDFYNEQLFDVHGWELLGDEVGNPGEFVSYKVRKDERQVHLMIRADSDGLRCLVMMKMYD